MQTESPLSKKYEGNNNKTSGINNSTARYILRHFIFMK